MKGGIELVTAQTARLSANVRCVLKIFSSFSVLSDMLLMDCLEEF